MKAIEHLKVLAMAGIRKKHPNVPVHALPRPNYSDRTANGLTRCIVDFLDLNGWQAERINSIGRPIDTRQTSTDVLGRERTVGSIKWVKTTGKNGTADISATVKGRSVKIEVKIGEDRQSPVQRKYQESIERAGGVYIIARNFKSFHDWYSKFMHEV